MSRKNSTAQVISEPEQIVLALESRRVSAEYALNSASEAKKSVEGDMETALQQLAALQNEKRIVFADIESTKQKALEAKLDLDAYKVKIATEKSKLDEKLVVVIDRTSQMELAYSKTLNAMASTKGEQTRAENELNSLKSVIALMSQEKVKLAEDISATQKRLDELKADYRKSTDELKQVGILKEEAEEAVCELENRQVEVKQELGVLVDECSLLGKEKLGLVSDIEKAKSELASRKESTDLVVTEANERTRIADLAEKRVQEKTEYLLRVIEKAKTDKLIGEFKI